MSCEDHRGNDLAPVIPLFGRREVGEAVPADGQMPIGSGGGSGTGAPGDAASAYAPSGTTAPAWNDTWGAEAERFRGHRGSADGGADSEAETDADLLSDIDLAEKRLLRRLRTRSLSVREARAALSEAALPTEAAEQVLERLCDLGYLDDAALAEQLVHIGVDRKGQGRQAIARTLAQRGVPRDVADAAIAELPDDDAERALEFARTKARSMRNLDHDTAVRRLSGQLARRGYGGAMAMDVARRALAENDAPTSGVRFR